MRKVFIFAIALVFIALLVFLAIYTSGYLEGVSFENEIALIPVKGEIISDPESSSPVSTKLSAMEIVDSIRDAEEKPRVKAILLEINSPGGSVVASRQIVKKILETEKPVIAWISDVGASGGYYVAAATDHIVADPDSITGSIGVVAVFPNIEGLLDILGIKVKTVKTGPHKTIGDIFEPLTLEQEKMLQQLLNEAFKRFKEDIISLREGKLNLDDFEIITDGRILSGSQAQKIGLVDELGTRELAFQIAAEYAGIESYKVLDYSKKELSFLDILTQFGYSFGSGARSGFFSNKFSGIKLN